MSNIRQSDIGSQRSDTGSHNRANSRLSEDGWRPGEPMADCQLRFPGPISDFQPPTTDIRSPKADSHSIRPTEYKNLTLRAGRLRIELVTEYSPRTISDAARLFAQTLAPTQATDAHEAMRFARWLGEDRSVADVKPVDVESFVETFSA